MSMGRIIDCLPSEHPNQVDQLTLSRFGMGGGRVGIQITIGGKSATLSALEREKFTSAWQELVGAELKDPLEPTILADVEPLTDGCWMAYHGDWSGIRVFGDELECLRYAVENHMQAKRVRWGEDPRVTTE